MKQKLNFKSLQIKSFVTSLSVNEKQTLIGQEDAADTSLKLLFKILGKGKKIPPFKPEVLDIAKKIDVNKYISHEKKICEAMGEYLDHATPVYPCK